MVPFAGQNPNQPLVADVPDAPTILGESFMGRKIPGFWEQNAEKYGARYRPDINTFETRPTNFSDLSGQGKHYDSDWPVEFLLGPPSLAPDWHPLLNKFGLQVMDQAGFINYRHHNPADLADPVGQLASFGHSDGPIHPVLRKDMWPSISQQDYDLMHDSLMLVTAILDEPDTLRFLHPLTQDPMVHMDFRTAQHIPHYFIMDVPPTLTDDEYREVYKKVVEMRGHTTFRFAFKRTCENDNVMGITKAQINPKTKMAIYIGSTWQQKSEIHIAIGYLELLQVADECKRNPNNHKYSDYLTQAQGMGFVRPTQRLSRTDPTAAIMRTKLLLANTILHELLHAFGWVYFDQCVWDANNRPASEPFLRGDRVAELGHAFEQYIWNANPRATTFNIPPVSRREELMQELAAPFGLHFRDPWDLWLQDDRNLARALDQVDTTRSVVYWPIAQWFAYTLFGKWKWVDQVPRFGLNALKLPKHTGWGVEMPYFRKGYHGTHPERWNEGANP